MVELGGVMCPRGVAAPFPRPAEGLELELVEKWDVLSHAC